MIVDFTFIAVSPSGLRQSFPFVNGASAEAFRECATSKVSTEIAGQVGIVYSLYDEWKTPILGTWFPNSLGSLYCRPWSCGAQT